MPFYQEKVRDDLGPEDLAGGKERRKRTCWIERGLCLLLPFWIMSCAVGPDFVRPKPPAVERYTYEAGPERTIPANGQEQNFKLGAQIVGDWWRLFNSSKLDAVIKEAIANNPNLQAAQASLRQSQENLRAGYGVFFPQLDGSFEASRQKFSTARFGGSLGSQGSSKSPSGGKSGSTVSTPNPIFSLYTLTGTINYALDVFGGERRTVESLRAQVDFQHHTVTATYITLTGNIINAIIAQAAYSALIKATEQMITLQKEQVGITETQTQAGTVP